MTTFSYSFRPSAFAPERHYSLGTDQLTWTGGGEGRLAYRAVAKVKVYKTRFWGSSRTYWTCILYPVHGRPIHLGAAHRLNMRAVEDRTRTYIPFIKELEARIAAANVDAHFVNGRGLLSWIEGGAGWAAVRMLRSLGRIDCGRSANALARLMRMLGPWLRGNRLARAQLKASFPEKSAEDVEKILDGMWDNIGRVVAEYAHLGALWDFDPNRPGRPGRIAVDPVVAERMRVLGEDRRPVLMFGAHLANWELAPRAVRIYGREIFLVYRKPKIAPIAEEVIKLRDRGVGGLIPAGFDAPLKVANALQQNHLVGMLVDQYDAKGTEVTFFGRPCRVNSMLGRVARLFDCPIYGARVIRLPGHRYQFDMTEPLTAPRDHEGKVDTAATMQMVTSIIEGWVREHPEQWMWTHRRWR